MRIALPSAVIAIAAISLLSIAPTSPLKAHEGASGVVKERMEAMKNISASMKVLTKTLKGERESAPAELEEAAQAIQQHAGEKLTALFPEGSLQHPSEATVDIWQDWSRFEELSTTLSDNAKILAMKIKQSGTIPKSDFMKVAGTCRDCHKAFREEK